MTQVSGNRGVQPPYKPSVSADPRRSVQSKSTQSVGQNAQPVRFRGGAVQQALGNGWNGFVNLSLPSFEKITEVFIWGFLAQDVIAMWLPRIYALLTEGRKKYDPKDDPKAKNEPFGTQFRKYIKGNVEGLNWQNFSEGTKREFATGPGLLIVPAGIFVAASRLVNPAIKMPFQAVKGLGKGLAEHMQDVKDKDAFRKELKGYVRSIFQDPKLTTAKGKELEAWSNQWVDNLYNENIPAKKQKMDELSKQLNEMVRDFNQTNRMEPYFRKPGAKTPIERLMEDEHPLHRKESTWISYRPKLLFETPIKEGITPERQLAKADRSLRQMPVTEVLRDLTRMEGMVKDIESRAKEVALSDAAQQTMQSLVAKKGLMSLFATVTAAAYTVKLAFWAQSHDTYQATRFLNEKTAQNHGSQPQCANAPSSRRSNMSQPQSISSTAGSANALQPAFSSLTPPQNHPFAFPIQQSGMFITQPAAQWPVQSRLADEGRNV